VGNAKDKTRVFYSFYQPRGRESPYKTVRVAGAPPESFSVKGADYAADGKQIYHSGKFLTKDVATFQVLPYLYAKTGSVIYYDGKIVEGADVATFAVLENPEAHRDAQDSEASYKSGVRVTAGQANPAAS
jgi:hypothetical protein